MKTIEKALLAGFFITILFNLTGFANKCESISDKVFRLHILANSDSKEDQELKLKVRDRVLKETSDLFKNAHCKEDAKNLALENIDNIKKIAEDEIHINGFSYNAKVEVVEMFFDTRQYDNIKLPAGSYNALRILIGQGKGHNWWCVMFPQLCIGSATKEDNINNILPEDQASIVDNSENYEVKFKVVECFYKIKSFFLNLFN